MPRANTDAAVLDLLARRWRRHLNVTTVRQAQDALALPRDVAQRLRLLEVLQRRKATWKPVAGYGATPLTLTLTEDEKLVARHMLDGTEFAEACERTGLYEASARTARRVLTATGFLSRGRITPDTSRFLEGTGLQFHTVQVEGEVAFNVPWAVDFLLLVSGNYPDHRLTIEDACTQTHRKMRVRFDAGEVNGTDPESLYLLRGGTWGTNNLFWSEEDARNWLTTHPDAFPEGERLALYFEAMRVAQITMSNVEGLRRSSEEYREMIQGGLQKVRARERRRSRRA
jgi:hypothetical protein